MNPFFAYLSRLRLVQHWGLMRSFDSENVVPRDFLRSPNIRIRSRLSCRISKLLNLKARFLLGCFGVTGSHFAVIDSSLHLIQS